MSKAIRIAPNPLDPLPIAFYVHADSKLSWSIFSDDLRDSLLFGTCHTLEVRILDTSHADHSMVCAGRDQILVTSTTAERVADALGLTIQAQPVAA